MAPICRFGGEWTVGSLRTLAGGYVFGEIHDGRVEAQLDRAEGPLRLHVSLARDGWHLFGRLDPEEEDVLRARAMTQLSDTVILSPGAPATLLDARDGAAGGGEVLLGVSRYARRADDGFRFVAPIQRWLPCDAVGLSFGLRDEGREAQERVAIGLPAEPPARHIAVGVSAQLAAAPGGAPFLEITPREYPEPVLLVGEQADQSRILVHHWDGTMILGWVASSVLAPPEDFSGGGLGMIGALGGPETLDVCTSVEQVMLFASHAGSPVEPIGWLDPGTRFVRIASSADGTFSLRPHPQGGVYIHGEDVVWAARSARPLVCAVEQYDASAAFAALRVPDATLAIRATITAARGLDGVAVGDACAFDVEHLPDGAYQCHAAISCAERVVFGHTATNGLFACELDAGDAPFVRGRDAHTSAASGDPAMAIDSTTGTLEIDDDASGPLGAIHIEARIDSVEVR